MVGYVTMGSKPSSLLSLRNVNDPKDEILLNDGREVGD
jgi:hypothetical protein